MSSWRAGAIFLLAFIRLNFTFAREHPLKCYQCHVERNDLCNEDSLTECPEGQAFDRCMTTVSYTKASGYEIRKTCALAPCNLRDRSALSSLGLDSCDRSKEEYLCVHCCKEDGCNKDHAHRQSPQNTLMATSLLFLIVAILCLR